MSDLVALVRKYGDARAGKALHNGEAQQAACDTALSAVQDEIERQQKRFADYALTCGRMLDEKDLQLVALREALKKAQPFIAGWTGFGDADVQRDFDECAAVVASALADTAAAARETERRLRVEGAEAMNAAWHDANCSLTHPEPPAAVVDAATAAGKWGEP